VLPRRESAIFFASSSSSSSDVRATFRPRRLLVPRRLSRRDLVNPRHGCCFGRDRPILCCQASKGSGTFPTGAGTEEVSARPLTARASVSTSRLTAAAAAALLLFKEAGELTVALSVAHGVRDAGEGLETSPALKTP